ncbi:Nucleic-acid-binding protein from mobile element jockey [Portunus trituberculatus]|uniref:Nucleic-acid-binding protein from mobile element jockey n=1 Tax=Portunus trituberculatus TaxID=210409 RepID=A0A5B7JQM7_PORTR|nr:Nucleic-acid-binding protein from mobile element jockey [Portunus trituberculatus]
MVYHVRPHTLPVLRCTRCLLFGHSNISCNGRARCKKCSGYHDTDGCVREDHCFFCGSGHRPTSKQCPARLQAVQLQELQHGGAHSLLDVKRKMRGILPGIFRPPNPAPKYTPPKPGNPQLSPYTSLALTHLKSPPLPPPLLLTQHPSPLPLLILLLLPSSP